MYRMHIALVIALHVAVIADHLDRAKRAPSVNRDQRFFVGVQEVTMDPSDPVKSKENSLVPFPHFNIRSYAGYFKIPYANNSGKLFGWFFPNSNPNAPLIVWLQGQPGISSLYGLFEEHGPFEIDEPTMTIKIREYALTNLYNVLYLDPETNCGYSKPPIRGPSYNKLEHISRQIYETLHTFLQIFIEYKNNHVYLAGESSCNRILPRMVQHIVYDSSRRKINLQGILVGGGVFHKDHALHYVGELFRLGIIDMKTVRQLHRQEHRINALLRAQNIDEAFDHIGTIVVGLKKSGYLSIYDVRDPLATLRSVVPRIVRRTEIRRALHVGNTPFKIKRQSLAKDLLLPVAPLYSDILSYTRVLLYNGQFDFFTSYPETESFISALSWRGTDDYYNSERQLWNEDGRLLGYWKTFGNLTHALVRNAGHWVGKTQPRALYRLFNKFVDNKFPSNKRR